MKIRGWDIDEIRNALANLREALIELFEALVWSRRKQDSADEVSAAGDEDREGIPEEKWWFERMYDDEAFRE
jgi:hypothetical protein